MGVLVLELSFIVNFLDLILTRGVQYIWNTKVHQMVMDEFIMLKKNTDYPQFIPIDLLGLETQGSIL